MKLPVYNREGQPGRKKVELDDAVFGIEPNEHAMWMAVKVQLTRMRQGTHATRNRAKVNGGGRKPWRQKGRGMARAGTTRSPLWRHGGTIFGPYPFKHTMRLPLKVNRLARASALATRASEEAVALIEDFSYEAPKTKDVVAMLQGLNLSDDKLLILTKEYDGNLVKSVKNVANCTVRVATEASTYDLLNHRKLLIQVGALEAISEVLGGRKRASEKAA